MVGKDNLAVKKVLDDIVDNIENNTDNKKTKKRKKKKNRCSFNGCNKKLKLTDFPCKCKKIFCAKHRTQESHDCEKLKINFDKEKFMLKCGLGGGIANKLIKI